MLINKGLTVLAGGVALAVSVGANAATTQTIILNIIDTTTGNAFVFDTSLPTSTSDPGVQSFDLNSNSAYQQFTSASNGYASTDVLEYGVVGYTTGNVVDTTSLSTPTIVAGNKPPAAATNLSQFLAAVGNPNGGATFQSSASLTANPATSWAVEDVTFTGNIGGVDLQTVGTAENFYALTTTNAHGTLSGAVVTQLASQWNLSSGVLTYGTPSAVPLPAPVVLLLSGLGLMGVVARRRSSAAV